MPQSLPGTLTLKFTGPTNSISKSYTYSSSSTPTGSLSSAMPITPTPTTTLQLTSTSSLTTTITSIKLVSKVDKTNTIAIADNTWSTTGSGVGAVTSFDVHGVRAGAYHIMVHCSPYGYYSISDTVNISFPTDGAPPASTQISSFNGGIFTITGNNLSPSSYITVNSLKGYPISVTTSSITYQLPALVTNNTQTEFKLK